MILDAAHRKFSHFGLKKVTMADIARDLDMGKASLYYYFRTKEELFQAVLTREHDHFMASLAVKIASAPTASAKIATYVLHRSEYFNRLLNLNILDLRLSGRIRPPFEKMFDRFSRQELRLLEKIIVGGRRSGEFTARPGGKVAEALLHTLQGLRIRFLRTVNGAHADARQFQELKQEQRVVTEIFLRGIQK
jgi:AcrR family transcriptional regulator